MDVVAQTIKLLIHRYSICSTEQLFTSKWYMIKLLSIIVCYSKSLDFLFVPFSK